MNDVCSAVDGILVTKESAGLHDLAQASRFESFNASWAVETMYVYDATTTCMTVIVTS